MQEIDVMYYGNLQYSIMHLMPIFSLCVQYTSYKGANWTYKRW